MLTDLRAALLIAGITAVFGLSNSTFVKLLFDEFGDRGMHEQKNLNLTSLAEKILDGRKYTSRVNICENANCSSQCLEFSSRVNHSLSEDEFNLECPRILYSLRPACIKGDQGPEDGSNKVKPSLASVWGYGFLLVTIINLCSFAGVFLLPLMKKQVFSTLLVFLVAVAVGSLATNGVLVLIPEGFGIMDMEGYSWRALCILLGVYLFYVTERILKMITQSYAAKRQEKLGKVLHRCSSIPIRTYIELESIHTNPSSQSMATIEEEVKLTELASPSNEEEHGDAPVTKHNELENGKIVTHIDSSSHRKPVNTVAYMIIFGDAFHNFIDGLSIGAALSDNILLGVSICIAVLCEELPHEIGDFAILLNAGMTKRNALLFNFLSACTCYIGLIIGISLGEIVHSTHWILAVAAGMFLYIALADMMPEMNHAAEEHKDHPIKVFIIQNVGLLFGFGIIFIVSEFGDLIDFTLL